ncbi:single-stranded DNA-binding protein [Microbacterium karelineae]|uniref:single-stranded DNA-binding protein n=1 Tax=Microbacterium karelineae TaxID=2654283 RepID=UPI0012EAA766|nr:single-stranded DNA-binding protein [Microbacterium karelineae]
MTETITITGNIATEPTAQASNDGVMYTRFRVACTPRRRNPETGEWSDGESNWYTVYAHGSLAQNAIKSLSKGMRVIVHGALKVRDWERDERRGTNVDINAESLGPDLRWGKTTYTTTSTGRRRDDEQSAIPGEPPAADADWGVGVLPEVEPTDVGDDTASADAPSEQEGALNPF